MQELTGKLAALDPEASEALKVVAYFDALIAGRVGTEGVLRGAAALAGTAVGLARHSTTVRMSAEGQRMPDAEPPNRAQSRAFAGGLVWLERDGPPHTNDEILLERLAFAIDLLDSTSAEASTLAVIVDATRSLEERVAALARLRIAPQDDICLLATAPGARTGDAPSAVAPTRYGMLQATLELSNREIDASTPTGVGQFVRADHAPESWQGAVIALRLSTPLTPVVEAADLGAMLLLARAYDPEHPHPDVTALGSLDSRSAQVLRVLVEADSIRSAASELAMHHSTLQAKHESLTRTLGYDPRSTVGRMRYIAAEMLRRIVAGPQ